MIKIVATNITSPLGFTTQHNFDAVSSGFSAVKVLNDWNGVPGQICVGTFTEQQSRELAIEGFSLYESVIIHSVNEALSHTDVDLKSSRTGLIIGTTKGNVDELGAVPEQDGDYSAPGESAKKVASFLGMTTVPVVVCNACISGVTAQLLAERLILAGVYDDVIVCGADTMNKFCVSGFLSFKAMSPNQCRPFDIERLGLNLGECASTIVLSKVDAKHSCESDWYLLSGCLNNDAYHISAPSPSGEGVLRAIKGAIGEELHSSLATVCAHGTATMFNDQMESKAIAAAGLSDVPLSAYKAYYGHTLGAAGVIEPILTMTAIDNGVVLPVLGFEEIGVSGRINVSNETRKTDKSAFLKIISGFGGCNGAAYYSKSCAGISTPEGSCGSSVVKTVLLTQDRFEINGTAVPVESSGPAIVTEVFKKYIADDSRFYKMDIFSKMVYAAAGVLIGGEIENYNPESVAIILFNRSSSLLADRKHIATFSSADGFYPSPSVFINTLPNVVVGEVAVKYNIKGETTFLILPERDEKTMQEIVDASLLDPHNSIVVAGWVDCCDENSFTADIKLIKKN